MYKENKREELCTKSTNSGGLYVWEDHMYKINKPQVKRKHLYDIIQAQQKALNELSAKLYRKYQQEQRGHLQLATENPHVLI